MLIFQEKAIQLNYPQFRQGLTQLDLLTEEALSPGNATKEIEEKISDFLADELIINRTQNCQDYFDKYITARAYVKKDINVSQNIVANLIL